MNDDELRALRMQHYWDQQGAAMNEIRRLISEETETAIGKVELSDREIHDLMTQYHDYPVPEWEWSKLIIEAGQPINGPPMMISWVDDEGVEDHTTLASQLFWFQAGWRAHNMRVRLRLGSRESVLPDLERMIGVTRWMLDNQKHEVPIETLRAYHLVETHAKRLIKAIEKLPAGHLSDDYEGTK